MIVNFQVDFLVMVWFFSFGFDRRLKCVNCGDFLGNWENNRGRRGSDNLGPNFLIVNGI
jgi:hypothetical protein